LVAVGVYIDNVVNVLAVVEGYYVDISVVDSIYVERESEFIEAFVDVGGYAGEVFNR